MMAPSREERFLMRQRGAGARQLRNSGFDFTIPGISASPGRSRRTPQRPSKQTPKAPPLLAQQSSQRTPATTRSKHSVPHQARAGVSSTNRSDLLSFASSETQSKGSATRKRKREPQLQEARLPTTVGEDGVSQAPGASEKPGSETSNLINGVKASSLVHPQLEILAGGSSKKRKKRRSIGQNSRKRIKTSLPDAIILAPSVSPLLTSTVPEDSEERASTLSPEDDQIEHRLDVVPHVGPATKRKRKKRKFIGKLPRVKRRSLDIPSSTLQNLKKVTEEESSTIASVRRKADRYLVPVEEFEDESELVSSAKQKTEIGKGLQSGIPSSEPRRRGRPKKSDVSRPSPTTRAAKKPSTNHSKSSKRALHPVSSSSAQNRDQILQRARPNSIPITVHRLAHFQVGSHSPAEDDVFFGPTPVPKKSSVNAVDVLSQICRELVAKTLESLQLAEAKERGDRQRIEQRKREVIELYGDELDARLFEMTEALDNNYALTVRLRQAKKEKVGLGKRLLEIKRQREKIVVDTDEVRAKHDRATRITQSEDDLDTMIQDLKLAVQRGRAHQQAQGKEDEEEGEVAFELSLRRVAEKVSSVGRLGLLERVRGFNALIEKAIAAI